LLWQALGLAGGLAAIGALLTIGVDGQQTRFAGVFGGLGRLASGQLLQPHQPPLVATLRLAMLAAGFALLSVLSWMLVIAFADAIAARRRQRELLALLARGDPKPPRRTACRASGPRSS
jgi:hypothetical protein